MTKPFVVLLAVAISGCALQVVRGNPRPNINLPASQSTLALDLQQAVKDQISIPDPIFGLDSAEVTAWRSTLETGFKNGFSSAFKPTDRASPELTLQIVDASIECAPTAVNQYGKTKAAALHIRYKANLVKGGEVVGRAAGTAESRRSFTDSDEFSPTLDSAVEAMFEGVAGQLFATTH